MKRQIETQILIIGAGSTGTAIARELSKYKVDSILVERGVDVCSGETKSSHGGIYNSKGLSWASSTVLKSFMAKPGEPLLHPESMKEKLTLKGFNKFDSLAKELDLSSYRRVTRILMATNDEEVKRLSETEKICKQTGVIPQRLNKDEVLGIEPNITKKGVCALLDNISQASLYPWEYVIALAENAQQNGVKIMLGTEVQGIRTLNGGFTVDTTRGIIKTNFIVNAAGAYTDRIAQMANVCDFGLKFLKLQMTIFDNRSRLISNKIGVPPLPGQSKGLNLTASGKIHTVGHGYASTDNRENLSTTREWGAIDISTAKALVPKISARDIITSFTGITVFNTRDPENHIVEVSRKNPNFINAVIRQPGITPSPAIAEYVVELLAGQGLEMVEKANFDPSRKGIPQVNSLSDKEKAKLISEDPRYGHVVCRCEQVTEGEIVEAIRRGASTVAGIKYRTRAGMGRCQSNHCGPRVVEILSRELNVPMTEVTQRGGLSHVLHYRSLELLS